MRSMDGDCSTAHHGRRFFPVRGSTIYPMIFIMKLDILVHCANSSFTSHSMHSTSNAFLRGRRGYPFRGVIPHFSLVMHKSDERLWEKLVVSNPPPNPRGLATTISEYDYITTHHIAHLGASVLDANAATFARRQHGAL